MRFYFAWVDPDETVYGAEHAVVNEQILSIDMTCAEGEFASLRIEIKNTYGIGLLSPTRKKWAWLSVDLDDATGGAVPLFFGRVVGVPSDLQGDIIIVELIGRPLDWDAQRRGLGETLKVLPFYDPVWLNDEARQDPDSVLEGYPALWHVDPVTHLVTISDILAGDTVVDVGEGFIRDSLAMRYGPVPGRRVAVRGTVQWDQQAAGTVDLTAALITAFRTLGGTSYANLISSFTGQGLSEDWPKPETRIGSGWFVGESAVERVDGRVTAAGDQEVVQTANGRIVSFPLWILRPTFKVNYEASRARSETVTFTLEADVQPMLTEPGDDEVLSLAVESAEVDQPIDAGAALPIGDISRNSYFQTTRGWRSIEHLIARARALLLARSRAVQVTVAVPFATALAFSCRKSMRLNDARLPCGEVVGKIVSYSLRMDGDSGECIGEVTIGCAVGEGNTVTDEAGDPLYVQLGYVNDGYQAYENRVVMPVAGEVAYTPPEGILVQDDGVDFNDMRAATVLEPILGTGSEIDEPAIDVLFGETAQRAIIAEGGGDMAAVTEALNAGYTTVRVNLKPLNRGPFEQEYAITVTNLMVPKMIDLACDGDTGT